MVNRVNRRKNLWFFPFHLSQHGPAANAENKGASFSALMSTGMDGFRNALLFKETRMPLLHHH